MPLRMAVRSPLCRLQEHLEPALREYHRPQERIPVEPDQALDLGCDRAVVIEASSRIVQALELVAALAAGAGGGTEHPPAPAFGEEDELDLHQAGAVGDERHHGPVIPGAAAVEHEEQGLQDGGLARSGVTHDGHQPGVAEVDGHLGAVAAQDLTCAA